MSSGFIPSYFMPPKLALVDICECFHINKRDITFASPDLRPPSPNGKGQTFTFFRLSQLSPNNTEMEPVDLDVD